MTFFEGYVHDLATCGIPCCLSLQCCRYHTICFSVDTLALSVNWVQNLAFAIQSRFYKLLRMLSYLLWATDVLTNMLWNSVSTSKQAYCSNELPGKHLSPKLFLLWREWVNMILWWSLADLHSSGSFQDSCWIISQGSDGPSEKAVPGTLSSQIPIKHQLSS